MHALSLPTWWIHLASVVEWLAAMVLVSQIARQPGRQAWYGLAWAMLPALVSAMCAITWHLFDNAPDLEYLVTWQAATTLVGNITLAAAAFWIWKHESQ
ncbi:MAG: DUF2499 domain-containing protein [Thermostichales cyanobacterium BF4_bins_65]